MLKKMKIRTQLSILITVMILLLFLTGLIGLFSELRMKQSIDSLYTHNVTAVEKLSDYLNQLHANYANTLNLIVTEDAESRKQILDDYSTRIGNIEKDINTYLKLDMDDYETKQYQLIQVNSAKWSDIEKQLMDNINSGNINGAKQTLTASGYQAIENLQTSISDLVNYNIKESDDLYIHNRDSYKKAARDLSAIIIISIIICCVLAVVISTSITKPINKLINVMKMTSNLDLTRDDTYRHLLTYKGDIGKIANAVADLRKNLREISGNILSISTNLAANSEELAATTEENTRSINQVVVAINEIAQGNGSQAEMVERTSETIKEMAESIDQVNKTTSEASDVARNSLLVLNEGQKAIDSTIEKITMNKKVTNDVGTAIKELSDQMDKVGSIISVINDISKQTNLLSLNASIEAARSGEAGKGFAIVAQEIGGLSGETADAVKEITAIIQATIEKNNNTARNNQIAKDLSADQEAAVVIMKEAFRKISVSVNDIVGITIQIADRMKKINESSKLISEQTNDISATAQEAAASSEEISASNEEQLASIEMISSAASVLSEMASELNSEISKFKF